ncbi:UNVERIFIED_CONTAM: hypothetical protein Slati_2068100 [Sesamum latifolium]|uniref:Uncharacterized protein n=1 Tax=Sesamum latifolium TaxID=2727402 RepID=A0AAW2WNR3_9LAMI
MGLPPGLLPKEVKSYNFSDSGLLEVFLDGPCLTKFDTMAFYESEVRANLTYGSLTGVEGLSQEELFLWLPVKDIIVDDPRSGLILIDIGVAHKQLSLSPSLKTRPIAAQKVSPLFSLSLRSCCKICAPAKHGTSFKGLPALGKETRLLSGFGVPELQKPGKENNFPSIYTARLNSKKL